MSNDTNAAAPDAQPLPTFEDTPWHVMLGARVLDDGTPDVRLVCTPLAAVERASGGVHFDKTMPAVYFGQWLEQNKQQLWAIAMREHAMYCNFKRATDGMGKSAALRLVDQDGERLN